jgi:hypothetical protein
MATGETTRRAYGASSPRPICSGSQFRLWKLSMCNHYRLLIDAAALFADFSEIKIKIRFSEGKPNIEAREDIKITNTAPIVRAIEGDPEAGDLVQRR